jgi:hypothetical protein
MTGVNVCAKQFSSFDIVYNDCKACNGVKYMVKPAEPEVRGSNPSDPPHN